MDPVVNLDQMMDTMDDPDLRPLRWIIITILMLFAFLHITCTTIMLSCIPNRVDSHDLKEWLEKSSFGHYDFSYLRIDFSTELNVGYAFVNFTHPEHITNFVNAKVGNSWSLYGSTKRWEVSYATIQGTDCLLANSATPSSWRRLLRAAPSSGTTMSWMSCLTTDTSIPFVLD